MKRFKCQTEIFLLADKKSSSKSRRKSGSSSKSGSKSKSGSQNKRHSKNKYTPEIERFRDAYQYGITANAIKKRGNDTFKFHIRGDSWTAANQEIVFNKQKKLHYMWYIFPQPRPNISRLSQTSQYFHISDEEVILFLNDKYLLENLSYAVQNLVTYHNDNPVTLKRFFELNGDDVKFSSFRRKFLEILRKIDRNKNQELQNLYDNLKLLKMPYDKK